MVDPGNVYFTSSLLAFFHITVVLMYCGMLHHGYYILMSIGPQHCTSCVYSTVCKVGAGDNEVTGIPAL
jgi:hypothetical protein